MLIYNNGRVTELYERMSDLDNSARFKKKENLGNV